jgi:hypothetical protein
LARVWKNKQFFAAHTVTVKEKQILGVFFINLVMSKMIVNADWKLFHCDATLSATIYLFFRHVKLISSLHSSSVAREGTKDKIELH